MQRNSNGPRVEGVEILEMIGQGGEASVYRAYQPHHDRVVALRVIRSPLITQTIERRFDRECQALGAVSDHPGIVSLLESGRTTDGDPYLMLEYASGGSLADRIESGPIPVDEATRIAIGIAGALEVAHQAGVLHRDVKPHNVMRSNYGVWQLGDFGVATLLDGRSAGSANVRVSFAHTAPESFEGTPASPSTDVYSLASTLLTMLTGDEPFAPRSGETSAATIRRVIFDAVAIPGHCGLPKPLIRLIESAMSKDPEQRSSSAGGFGAELNRVRNELGLPTVALRIGARRPDDGATGAVLGAPASKTKDVGGPSDPPGPPTLDTPPGGGRPRRLTTLFTAAALLVVGVVGGWALGSGVAGLNEVADAPIVIVDAVVPDEIVPDVLPVLDGGDGPAGPGPGGGVGGGGGGRGRGGPGN